MRIWGVRFLDGSTQPHFSVHFPSSTPTEDVKGSEARTGAVVLTKEDVPTNLRGRNRVRDPEAVICLS